MWFPLEMGIVDIVQFTYGKRLHIKSEAMLQELVTKRFDYWTRAFG